MMPIKSIGIFIFLFLFEQLVFSEVDVNRYCKLESQCIVDDIITSPLHIGCPKSFAYSPTLYTLIKLKHYDREFIVNEINQFRSDIAMGVYSKIFNYPLKPMNKLEWSYELEYLISLMISKVPNTNFYCMATEINDRPSQLYVLTDRPQPFNLQKSFTLAINEIKAKALQSFRDANIGDKVSWSQIYDINTWAVGCAIGEFNSINVNDKLLIRCAFYGSKHEKQNVTTVYAISTCPSHRRDSQSFPSLCVIDNLKKMTGDRGDIGPPGNNGLSGNPGYKGDKGKMGIAGSNGDIGLIGITGDAGEPGYIGQTIKVGERGDKGDPGLCIKGSIGTSGQQGNPGQPGKIGLKGKKGTKGEQGETISLDSLKGEHGDQTIGLKGQRGANGEDGVQGPKGISGIKGEKGKPGHLQYDGDKCIICPISKQGSQGPPGPPGPIGPPGTVEYETVIVGHEVTTKKFNLL